MQQVRAAGDAMLPQLKANKAVCDALRQATFDDLFSRVCIMMLFIWAHHQ